MLIIEMKQLGLQSLCDCCIELQYKSTNNRKFISFPTNTLCRRPYQCLPIKAFKKKLNVAAQLCHYRWLWAKNKICVEFCYLILRSWGWICIQSLPCKISHSTKNGVFLIIVLFKIFLEIQYGITMVYYSCNVISISYQCIQYRGKGPFWH